MSPRAARRIANVKAGKFGVCTALGCVGFISNIKRGWCRNCYARFLRTGSTDRTNAPDGAGTRMKCGYIRVRNGGEKMLAHRVVAERALGHALPPGAVVHHVDGDRANNTPSNLVICPSESYHKQLHARQRARARRSA